MDLRVHAPARDVDQLLGAGQRGVQVRPAPRRHIPATYRGEYCEVSKISEITVYSLLAGLRGDALEAGQGRGVGVLVESDRVASRHREVAVILLALLTATGGLQADAEVHLSLRLLLLIRVWENILKHKKNILHYRYS